MIADPDQALKAGGLKNRKRRFPRADIQRDVLPFSVRVIVSSSCLQVRIFIHNQWLKSAYRAEKCCLCSDRRHIVVLLAVIIVFFFDSGIGLKWHKTRHKVRKHVYIFLLVV